MATRRARWQPGGMIFACCRRHRYQVGVGGPASNFMPPTSFWASPGGMKAGGGSLYSVPSAVVTAGCNASLLKPEGGGYVFMMQVRPD